MGRTLSAARARVRPADESAYLAALPARRADASLADRHFWVFRSRTEPGLFLEFVESADADAPTDAELEADRGRGFATYDDDAAERWDEVALD